VNIIKISSTTATTIIAVGSRAQDAAKIAK